jgi:restriction endonuclease S subunit
MKNNYADVLNILNGLPKKELQQAINELVASTISDIIELRENYDKLFKTVCGLEIDLACDSGEIESVGHGIERRINPESLDLWIEKKKEATQ